MSSTCHGNTSGSLELDAAMVPQADQQGILTRLNAAQIDREGVLLAAVQTAAVKPDLNLRDWEIGPDEQVCAALPGAVWTLEPPICWSRIAECAI
jgi:hypothetical protein